MLVPEDHAAAGVIPVWVVSADTWEMEVSKLQSLPRVVSASEALQRLI